jgi:hypothetical protein
MHTTSTYSDEIASLQSLATQVAVLGLHGTLCHQPGQLPYLDVRNPRASVLGEKVFAQAGMFWWSWAERIGPCGEVADAAAFVARVLRTVDGE